MQSYRLAGKDRARFEALFERTEKCWEWQGCKLPFGHGRFMLKVNGEWGARLAHRVSYCTYRGDIPRNQCVLHTCDNPACVNPGHLFLGSRADNTRDMVSKGRGRGGNNKLKESQVLAIRADKRAHSAIAKDYGIHQSLVSRIKSRKIWRFL